MKGNWGRFDRGHNPALASFKQQEGQVMTQQTTLAWLTRYILYTGVNEFGVRVFVPFIGYVDRYLEAVQMASMLLP